MMYWSRQKVVNRVRIPCGTLGGKFLSVARLEKLIFSIEGRFIDFFPEI
jgi:hypothetical protein